MSVGSRGSVSALLIDQIFLATFLTISEKYSKQNTGKKQSFLALTKAKENPDPTSRNY